MNSQIDIRIMIGASQNRHFSLVTIRILWEYIMSHDDQFHKFLFIISTTRVKRYDIVHEVDVLYSTLQIGTVN